MFLDIFLVRFLLILAFFLKQKKKKKVIIINEDELNKNAFIIQNVQSGEHKVSCAKFLWIG